MDRGLSRIADGRVRLGLLLAALASLVAYVALSGFGTLGFGTGPAAADDCPAAAAPSVQSIGRHELFELREGLRRMVLDGGARLYEQGPAESSYMWSDDEPGTAWALSPAPSQPGGYELRWQLSNGAALASMGSSLPMGARPATSSSGRRAGAAGRQPPPSTPSHRRAAATSSGATPTASRRRICSCCSGRRVYRVGTVLPGVGGKITSRGRREGFSLVDELACALPGAPCYRRGTPA